MIDLLIVNSLGPGFTLSSSRNGLGGSELEVIQIAHAFARKGYKVVVANGVTAETEEEGVRYIPVAKAAGTRTKILWIERSTNPPPGIIAGRTIVRATDICSFHYDIHRSILESGVASVFVNTQWQADGFVYAKHRVIIPPALDLYMGVDKLGPVGRVPGRFVYASAPLKGLEDTLQLWRKIMGKHPELVGKVHLKIAVPAYSDMYGDRVKGFLESDSKIGVSYEGMPSLVEWRRLIASAGP